MALPAFACRTPLLLSTGRAAIDRYLLLAGPQQQTRFGRFAADRQTGRQDGQYTVT